MAPPNNYEEVSFAPAPPSPRRSATHRRNLPHAPSCNRCFRREKSRCRLRRLSNILPIHGPLDNLSLPAPAASFTQARPLHKVKECVTLTFEFTMYIIGSNQRNSRGRQPKAIMQQMHTVWEDCPSS
ncbi:hypothetical protein RRG08_011085 [Elysia crispata]|uniref:Uncharacterized protein n=1 Tax=Elysia crispata TaxID=231223 RepID=A0AAE1DD37_9GAST|nr:hypothetical protein RRG08_011085 [Elysia crispata]